MSPTARAAIEQARREITRILRDLEIETGEVVEDIHVRDVDITCVDDDRQQAIRFLCIEMRRQPGMRWSE